MQLLKYFVFMFLMLQMNSSKAQDTVRTLSLKDVVSIVTRYHPVARQADIHIEKAKADLTISRGLFDPTIKNESAEKVFNGTDYYIYNRPELNIPTWFGIEMKAGVEYLGGGRTSPEQTQGESSYLGISIPLAKNLLMDKRRATLRTAKLFKDASSVEKRNILNDLLLESTKAYWYWLQHYQIFKILEHTVVVNEQRVKLVKTAYNIGERPAIDTTEAITQLQAFELMKSQAWLNFQNAGLELSLHLWTDKDLPADLPQDIVPADDLQKMDVRTSVLPSLDTMLSKAVNNHPELIMYNYKLDVLDIDKKLKFQELLPTVNFRYNHLVRGYDFFKTVSGPLFENNFQYGVSVAIPLRFSQGRGEYKKAKLNIEEAVLQRNNKLYQIQNKVKSYYNELLALQYQVILQQQAYENYFILQRGEEVRFRGGESTLFLINARETKALDALQKLQELKTKFYTTGATLQWSAGLLLP